LESLSQLDLGCKKAALLRRYLSVRSIFAKQDNDDWDNGRDKRLCIELILKKVNISILTSLILEQQQLKNRKKQNGKSCLHFEKYNKKYVVKVIFIFFF
jgi:hypothetical protein